MTPDEAFLTAIFEAPMNDDGPWNMYSDWLEERDDRRAVLFRNRKISNSIGMELTLIPHGKFLMGSPASEAGRYDDEDQHEVAISRPFYAGVYQVTQEEYESVIGRNPSYFSAAGNGKDKVKGFDTRRFPVENVSWDDAVEFCRRLSEISEEKRNGRVYRLPAEAEWEYMCRGGASSNQPFHFGNSLSSLQANFDGNSPYGKAAKGPYLGRPTVVGSYPANSLGLYDLHGNVWEWCADWYGEYPDSAVTVPRTDTSRVVRGGSWSDLATYCRAACRFRDAPGVRNNSCGFRVGCASLCTTAPITDPTGHEIGADRVLRGGSFLNQASDVRSSYRLLNVPPNRNYANGFRAACEV